ncbi:MAG: transcriptional repressor [Proteobacteria bacterium]|nr:transcriptional repressor [Pseudomonadota bacterium]MBU1139645.1 transcriptional repressor [Pseudomonadota bacterium]MBU1233020.1 transcriptional repressor [Pseudomonadota bacterium]MBU1420809.1 transcriptional repressor [Pseudomonadota bacterium]MBU1454857.1 transcriptional repressor [Pseudomonadota bacterium]
MQLRMTNQREMILRELNKSKGHLTADELYERVRKSMPRISLATVYRNLEILSEAGIVRKLEISGRQKRFDSEIEEHDHIYCVQCHHIENLLIDKSRMKVPTPDSVKGYTITGCRLEVTGLCPECQQKLSKTKKKTTSQKGDNIMGCGCKKDSLTDEQKQVLEAMAKCDGPCASKDIASATGLEAKEVSCRITALKKKGYVDSPVRCKYAITSEGKTAIKS